MMFKITSMVAYVSCNDRGDEIKDTFWTEHEGTGVEKDPGEKLFVRDDIQEWVGDSRWSDRYVYRRTQRLYRRAHKHTLCTQIKNRHTSQDNVHQQWCKYIISIQGCL